MRPVPVIGSLAGPRSPVDLKGSPVVGRRPLREQNKARSGLLFNERAAWPAEYREIPMGSIRPLFFAICLAAPLFGGAALATGDQPDCHGQNQEDCRPDPNEHGQDCDPHGQHGEMNDDHCGTTTTTAAATTTTLLPTVITAAPTTTTTGAATTTTLAMTPFVSATTTTLPTAVLGTQVEKLPVTGFPIGFLLVCSSLAIAFGLALRYVNKLEQTS